MTPLLSGDIILTEIKRNSSGVGQLSKLNSPDARFGFRGCRDVPVFNAGTAQELLEDTVPLLLGRFYFG
jgi:hypothetical protein